MQEIKDMGRELEKLKLESALRDTASQAAKQKAEREWVKQQRKLKEQLASMASKLNEEKMLWLSKLQLKEEEEVRLRKLAKKGKVKGRERRPLEFYEAVIIQVQARNEQLQMTKADFLVGLDKGIPAVADFEARLAEIKELAERLFIA